MPHCAAKGEDVETAQREHDGVEAILVPHNHGELELAVGDDVEDERTRGESEVESHIRPVEGRTLEAERANGRRT